jgi:hypothetical protein
MGEDGGLATFKKFNLIECLLKLPSKISPSSIKLEGFLLE